MQRASTRQLLIVACVVISGCATKLPPNPSGADVRGQVPAGALPAVARIVANELPIELVGFWNDPKDRAEFEKQRAANIDQRFANTRLPDPISATAQCLRTHPLCIVAAPLIIPAAYAAMLTEARIKAGRAEPSIPISEKDSARHVALFTEGLSGVSLGERTLRLIRSAPARSAKESEYPRLLISMKSASVRRESGDSLRISIVALARAYPSAGVAWEPTEHEVDFEFSPTYDYGPRIPIILDELARSIVSTYLPEHPFSVEKRDWERVRNTNVAQVQTYLDRYPEGTFADLAREQIAKLAAEEAAAQKLAAEKAAVEKDPDIAALRKLFMARAHVRPELEGRWAGVTDSPACGRGFYTIVINNGYVEGSVDWQGNAATKLQVSGYVKADGAVSFAAFPTGPIGRPAESSLVLQAGFLVGNRIEACGHYTQTFISLSRN